jgi:hypothetical protein
MVSTQDSESCYPSSNLGGTYQFFCRVYEGSQHIPLYLIRHRTATKPRKSKLSRVSDIKSSNSGVEICY